MPKLRDVVVVRVSEKGDREDERFHSPEVQIEAARRWARDRGERLVASPIPEIDVSGKLPLSKRPGLLAAIEMIEAGRADQLVVAYFDRLVRDRRASPGNRPHGGLEIGEEEVQADARAATRFDSRTGIPSVVP